MEGPVESNHSSSLLGKTAVVTGSSSGIGRAIALELAAAGADVMIHARTSGQAAREVADLVETQGRRAAILLSDLADVDQHRAFVAEAWDWSQGIDIWVNNAGADVLTGPKASWSFNEKIEYLWHVDVRATIALSRLAGQRMRDEVDRENRREPGTERNGSRSILNIGWDQVEQGMGGDSGEMFAAIKGAVMAFTNSLARSLAPQVRVNCLAPGWIRTAWGEDATEYWQRRARNESLLQRWGTPEDVARVARFLASPDAGFVTGQVVNVNGGFCVRTDESGLDSDGVL